MTVSEKHMPGWRALPRRTDSSKETHPMLGPMLEISATPLLDGLDDADLRRVLDVLTMQRFSRNQYVFHTGDPADCIYIVHQGMVRVSYGNARGDEKVVGIFQPGDLFGGLFLGKYRTRIGMAQALDDVVVARLMETDLLCLMQDCPRLSLNLVRYYADTQREILAHMHALMHQDARSRLLGTLLHFARRYCCTQADWFTLPACITQEDLAQLTCLNRSTVNVLINTLRQQDVLGGSGRTLTVNRSAVVALLEAAGIEILE